MLADTPVPPDLAQLEQMAALLDASGQYRVLRRIIPEPPSEPPADVPTRLGLFGIDPVPWTVCELGGYVLASAVCMLAS